MTRWTMTRRCDWPHDHGSLVPPDAPVPRPDEQLEVFDVVRADEVERLRVALDKPLRETILSVLMTMPKDAAPEHVAAMIEGQVRAWQAIP